MRRRIAWWLVVFFATAIAAYGFTFATVGEKMFAPQLADSFRARPWAILSHAFIGSVGLITGALQFHRGLLRRRRLHRAIGTLYITASVLTGVVGLYLARFAFGGLTTSLGFGALAIALLVTTAVAYARIRRRNIASHREWMIRSYSLMFAAVTLRIWLPLLIVLFGRFTPAYMVVAWVCWVPNILFAEALIRLSREREAELVSSLQPA